MGDLATLTPLCSPLLWSSVATGHYADRHGVLDIAEPDPVTAGVRPVTRASLRSPHIWDLLAHEGLRCQTIGWPVTHPAAGASTCVSDGFACGVSDSIYPKLLEPTIAPLRFQPNEWTGNELHLFVPEMARIDQDKDKRLAQLAVVLAEAVSVHAAATTLLESEVWDFTAVWFGVAARALELFPNSDDPIYGKVSEGVYRLLDLMLGRLLRIAGEDAVVMLVSDRTAGESEWQRSAGRGPKGLLCAAGPGIEPDELTFGSGLLDIAPTILGLFGFAPAPGMPGRAIPEICRTKSFRALANVDIPAPQRSVSPAEAALDIEARELEKLGYTDSIAAAWRAEAKAAEARRQFHLARVLLAQGRMREAVPLFEDLVSRNPTLVDLRLFLAHAYFRSNRVQECRATCEALLREFPDSPFVPLGQAHLAIAEGNYQEALAQLASAQSGFGIIAELDASVGEAYLQLELWEEAAAAFRSAIQTDAGIAAAHEGLARALLELKQPSEAAEAALDAIRLRYDLPRSHQILGRALEALGRQEAAAGAFANADALNRQQVV